MVKLQENFKKFFDKQGFNFSEIESFSSNHIDDYEKFCEDYHTQAIDEDINMPFNLDLDIFGFTDVEEAKKETIIEEDKEAKKIGLK
jgi:hypothetical protein